MSERGDVPIRVEVDGRAIEDTGDEYEVIDYGSFTDKCCPTCNNEGVVERLATPEEVDAGCELGIAYDPCPNEGWHNR